MLKWLKLGNIFGDQNQKKGKTKFRKKCTWTEKVLESVFFVQMKTQVHKVVYIRVQLPYFIWVIVA